MTAQLVKEILGIYRKHGWEVESVLLSETGAADLGGAVSDLFGDAPVRTAEIDAVWFGRPSKKGRKAIELRLLASEPFAYFELLEADASEEEISAVKNEVERKAAGRASNATGSATGH